MNRDGVVTVVITVPTYFITFCLNAFSENFLRKDTKYIPDTLNSDENEGKVTCNFFQVLLMLTTQLAVASDKWLFPPQTFSDFFWLSDFQILVSNDFFWLDVFRFGRTCLWYQNVWRCQQRQQLGSKREIKRSLRKHQIEINLSSWRSKH